MTHAVQDPSGFKVAVVCYPYSPSRDTGRGHDRYIAELIENIRSQLPGVALDVVHPGLFKSIAEAGAMGYRLVFELLGTKADVFHAVSPVGGTVATMIGKAPLVVTIHDLIPFNLSGYDPSWKLWIWRHFIRLCLKRAAAIIVPYQVTKDELVERLGTPADKVHVVNYGVDHDTYRPRPEVARSSRKILYLGEVKLAKGVDTLIQAFRKVKDVVHDAELVIGGKRCKDQEEVEALARSLGLHVTFAGFIPEEELPHYYASSAVMVFPSRCGFGLSTLEAMACRTPVVAVAALDAPEFIGDAGLLVEPDDTDGLAQALIRTLLESGLSEELQRKSEARASLFSWARMARETARVYQHVLGKAAQRTDESAPSPQGARVPG